MKRIKCLNEETSMENQSRLKIDFLKSIVSKASLRNEYKK